MAEEAAVVPENAARRRGWVLLAVSLAAPFAMAAAGVVDAFRAGELVVYVGFAWLAAALVIDLLTRKKSAIVKANGRIVAAALALSVALVSGFNTYRDTKKVEAAKKELIEQFMASSVEARTSPQPATAEAPRLPAGPSELTETVDSIPAGASDTDKSVALLRAMKIRAKEFAEASGALERKFNALDLSNVLAPQNLVSAAGIAESRATLSSYEALVRERGALINKHFSMTEQHIRAAGFSEIELNNALAGMNAGKAPVQKAYAELDAAQLASVAATADVLNFAENHLGTITNQNGQLMFAAQQELDEYRRLMERLSVVAEKEDDVTRRTTAFSQATKQNMVDQLK